MRVTRILALASIAAGGAGALVYARYRAELDAIVATLEAGSRLMATAAGPIEVGLEGSGPPVLMIHGAGGGYDQGLAVGRELMGPDFTLIAPSRFGYLRTLLPADASPAAQARAHAALLDSLGIDRCIVAGISAGAPSAVEFALHHPDRVSALLLLSPRTYDPANRMGVAPTASNEAILTLMESTADFVFWVALGVARTPLLRFFGVPPEVDAAANPAERDRVSQTMGAILPLSRRAAGVRADSATELSEWPLARISAPTLIVAARDDLFATLPGAEYSAARIPGAELKTLDDGGHLMIGRGAEVRAVIADFLHRRSESNAAETPQVPAAPTA